MAMEYLREGDKPSWLQCILLGFLVTPLAIFLIYLSMGFLPEPLEATAKNTFVAHPLLSGLVFYVCGVLLYRWIGLDLTRKENWPDLPG